MRVWIDQDCCTGAGLCVDRCPDLFIVLDDGIGYVREAGVVVADPGRTISSSRLVTRTMSSMQPNTAPVSASTSKPSRRAPNPMMQMSSMPT